MLNLKSYSRYSIRVKTEGADPELIDIQTIRIAITEANIRVVCLNNFFIWAMRTSIACPCKSESEEKSPII